MHTWTRAWVVVAALVAVLVAGLYVPATSSAEEPTVIWEGPGPATPLPDDPDGLVSVIIELAPTFSLFSFGLDSVQAAQGIFESSPPVELDVQYRYRTISAVVASLDADDLVALQDDPRVLAVVPNELMSTHLAEGNAMINQPAAIALGHDGTGVVVAVIDTGVDSGHPALAGVVIAEHCFSLGLGAGNRGCPNGAAEQHGAGAAADYGAFDGGHGTAVASIIASQGGSGVSAGVAPGASRGVPGGLTAPGRLLVCRCPGSA